jgi:hypothetical protein
MESDMDWLKVIPLSGAYFIGKLYTVEPVYSSPPWDPQKVVAVFKVGEIFFGSFCWVGD